MCVKNLGGFRSYQSCPTLFGTFGPTSCHKIASGMMTTFTCHYRFVQGELV